jgi:hypothetical protein
MADLYSDPGSMGRSHMRVTFSLRIENWADCAGITPMLPTTTMHMIASFLLNRGSIARWASFAFPRIIGATGTMPFDAQAT